VSGQNGHSNGHSKGAAFDLKQGRSGYLQAQLGHAERPARLVGLFSARDLAAHEMERLIGVCQDSLREEDPAAALTLAPIGQPSPDGAPQRHAWRVSVVEAANAAPHDCVVQVSAVSDPTSPHRDLLTHFAQLDAEMGRATAEAVQQARTYVTVSSGKLDDRARIHPFQNLVALFATALGALIVDPAAVMVTQDPGEWADALEMSLELESGMKLLRR
jgi:hypothetical protein